MAMTFKCTIDGTEYTLPQLKCYEYGRTIHMLHEMKDLGAKIMDGGRELTHRDINYLTFEDAHRLSVETRWELGPDGIEKLFQDCIEDSMIRWKKFNAVPIEEQGYQYCVDLFEVEGMPLPMLQASDDEDDDRPQSTMIMAELRQKLEVNPEHYIPGRSLKGGGKGSVEVVGMYGEPICMLPGKVTLGVPDYLPYQADPDYDLCTTVELNFEDGSPVNLGVTHEFKVLENGFLQKSTYFCPKNAPEEIREGHKVHFAIEMFNDYTIAYANYMERKARKGEQ